MYVILLTISLLFAAPAHAQLTAHQRHHLNAAIAEMRKHGAMPLKERNAMADRKRIPRAQFKAHLRAARARVRAMIAANAFPAGVDDPSDIHDYIEDFGRTTKTPE